jgi:hypothetical protein
VYLLGVCGHHPGLIAQQHCELSLPNAPLKNEKYDEMSIQSTPLFHSLFLSLCLSLSL